MSPRARSGAAAALVLAFVGAAGAAPRGSRAALETRLRAIAARFGGVVTLAGADLRTGASFGLNADQPVATASIIKLPVMVEAFFQMQEGKLHWSQVLTLRKSDQVPGSGILQDLDPGLHLTLGDAITLMIDLSDNTAANLVIAQTGIAAVNARMRRLGLAHTELFSFVFHPPPSPQPEGYKKFGLGETTAADMVRLLTLIQERKIVTPAACDRMLAILKQQQDNDAFPRFTTSDGRQITWAHKTGALNAVRNDVGIATTPSGAIVLAGFAQDSPDRRWTADNAALLVLARLAQTVVDWFAPVKAGGAGR
ncbi:MAG TPA: serine hydrolase [Terriglobales bacterium]|nr:serine hydrolase [Terriglobales bacterium]